MRSKYTLSLSTMAPIESELTEYLESLEKGHHRSGEIRRLILYGFVRLINDKSKEEATFDSLDDSSKKALLEILESKNKGVDIVKDNAEKYSLQNKMNAIIAENEALKKSVSEIENFQKEEPKKEEPKKEYIEKQPEKQPEKEYIEKQPDKQPEKEVHKEEIFEKDELESNDFYFEDPKIDLDEDIKDPLSFLS